MQNLMQIRCFTSSIILNMTATQYTYSLNSISHPHWVVQWSHQCSPMCIPVHSSARLHRCCANHSHSINNDWTFCRQTLSLSLFVYANSQLFLSWFVWQGAILFRLFPDIISSLFYDSYFLPHVYLTPSLSSYTFLGCLGMWSHTAFCLWRMSLSVPAILSTSFDDSKAADKYLFFPFPPVGGTWA